VLYYLYNNNVFSMQYAKICPKVRRYNARPEGEFIMPSNNGTYFGILQGEHNIIVIITLNVLSNNLMIRKVKLH
jgi:hypothetical protein